MSHQPELKPVHYKALELIEEGMLSWKEIAKQCGWGEEYLCALIGGDERQAGSIVHQFKAELDKISQRFVSKEKELCRHNRLNAQLILDERLKDLKKKKPTKDVSYEATRILQVLDKSRPHTEVSLTYYKGLSKEELENEFRKLAAIAERASHTGRIPPA